MKKHYVRITAVICVLILIAFLLGGFLFTYVKVQQVNEEYMKNCQTNSRFQSFGTGEDMYDLNVSIRYAYNLAWRSAALYRDEYIGFYGRLDWQDDEAPSQYLDSSNYVRVYTVGESGAVNESEVWIVPVTGNLDGVNGSAELGSVTLDGACEKVIAFNGMLQYQTKDGDGHTYVIGNPLGLDPDSGYEPDEWSERDLYAEYISLEEDEDQAALNADAAKVWAQFQEELFSETGAVTSREGWFTSYYMYYKTSTREITWPVALYGVYVFHPFSITLEKNLPVYVLFLVVLLAMEIMVILVSRKMYQERRKYELRSQRMTRSIAHDLKTPLAVTKAYVENWEYIDDENRQEYAENINQEVDQMTGLVNTLLDLSNLDAGNQDPKLEEVELLSLTKSLYRRVEPLVKERDLDVQFVPDREDGEYLVMADLQMMKIAIGNFLSNAIKYSEKKVRIEFLQTGKNVQFLIANDGAKISKKEQKKVWDLFYKSDSARTNRLGSNGVGLSVNKSILELHKAKYGCRSNNEETVFWFEMRKAESNGDEV